MQNYKDYDFVVLIPVYQDYDKIGLLKEQLDIHLSTYNYFICFVDDSLNEKTSETILKYFVKNSFILRRKKIDKFSIRYSASYEGFKWITKNIKSKPKDIPVVPNLAYKNNGWINYKDWLGY